MAILTVRNKKTGKVVRTVDSITGNTLKKFDSKGRVTSDFTKSKGKSSGVSEQTGFSFVVKDPRTGEITQSGSTNVVSDSLKSAISRRKSESSSETTKQQLADLQKKALQAKIVDLKTGKTVQKGNFELDRDIQRNIKELQKIERINKETQLKFKKQKEEELKLKKINEEIVKDIFLKQNTIENKILTGQSVTPQQFKQFEINLKKTNKELSKKELDNLVKVIISPVNYGRNLVIRNQGGEKNPFANDIKSFTLGFKKTTVDLVSDLVKLGWKGSEFSVKSAFNYGKRIQREAQKGNFVLDDDLKKVITPIFRGAKTAVQKTNAAIKFTKKEPLAAAIIVATAIGSGISVVGNTGKNITKLTVQTYKSNPADFFGQAAGLLLGGEVLKGIGIGVSKVSNSKVLKSVLHSQKFSSNKFVVKTDLVTGISKISGNTKGTFLNGKKFTTKYRITVNSKTKKVTGQLRTTSGKKTIVEQVNLIDKPGFYLNPKTGAKVPKILAGIKSRRITLKQTTLTPLKGTERTFIQNGVVASTKDADFTSIITRIINNHKKISIRTGTIRLSSATQNEITKIKNFATQFTKQVGKVKRTTQSKPLTKTEITRLKNFIETVGVENLKGLDRRIKIAKVLGVRKTSQLLKPLERIVDKLGQVKKITITKGKATFKGEIIKVNKVKRRFKLNIKTRKLSDLRKSKKASISLIQNNQLELLNKQGKSLRIKQIIEIPALQSSFPLTIPRLEKLRILGKSTILLRNLGLLQKLSSVLKPTVATIKQTNKIILAVKQDIVLINKVIQTAQVKNLPKVATILKTISISRTVPKVQNKAVIPKIVKGSPAKVVKIPTIGLSIKSLPKGGLRKGYIIKVKKENRILSQSQKTLPLKRATNLAREITDGSKGRYPLGASYDLIPKGKTAIKDVKKLVLENKFRAKKSKKPTKVLRSVEKKKFRADTPQEKRALSKLKKSKIKRKTPKKGKVNKPKKKK